MDLFSKPGARLQGVFTVLMGGAFLIASPGISAEEREYKPAAAETITHINETLTGDDSKTVIIKEFVVPPAFVGKRHTHPASVYVYVLEGKFTVELEGEEPRTLMAGDLYKEDHRRVMHARNDSTNEAARILVFQIGETGKPMMVLAE